MQGKLKSLLIVASLVATAAIIFVACGKGEPLEFDSELIDLSERGLANNLLDKNDTHLFDSLYNAYSPSSSSEEEEPPPESSSSDEPGTSASSSSQQQTQSSSSSRAASSSSRAQSSSSSSKPAASSSSRTTPPASGCGSGDQKSGVTCNWDGWTSGATLTPGKILKPAKPTLPSGCSVTSWKYAPDNTDISLMYLCEPVPEEGITAAGSQNYVLFAELDCDGKKHSNFCKPEDGWSSKKAPELTGKCAWAKNPTTTARGGIPDGVSIVDTDGVCKTKSVVYKYAEGTKDWPMKTGILDEWKTWDKKHKETYEVEATLNCPEYSQTVTLPCPPLEVSAGTDYIIECTGGINDANCGGAGKNSANLKLDECVEMNVIGYTDQHYLPTMIMRCNAEGAGANVSVTISLNGTGKTYTGSYSWNGEIEIGKVKVGDNEFGTLCLTAVSGATSVKCVLGNK